MQRKIIIYISLNLTSQTCRIQSSSRKSADIWANQSFGINAVTFLLETKCEETTGSDTVLHPCVHLSVCVCLCRAAQRSGDDGLEGSESETGHQRVEQRDRPGETRTGPSPETPEPAVLATIQRTAVTYWTLKSADSHVCLFVSCSSCWGTTGPMISGGLGCLCRRSWTATPHLNREESSSTRNTERDDTASPTLHSTARRSCSRSDWRSSTSNNNKGAPQNTQNDSFKSSMFRSRFDQDKIFKRLWNAWKSHEPKCLLPIPRAQ